MSTAHETNHELRLASEEHSARVAKFNALKTTILDRSLSMELRLRAHMQIDNLIWQRRLVVTEYKSDEPDKITVAKQRSEVVRLERVRAERAAQGLPTRTRRVIGSMSIAEPGDRLASPPPGVCHNCGKRFDTMVRVRTVYCRELCRREAYRARKRMVNE